MKILVTGATGFLGNYVIDQLLKRGIEVIATARNETRARTFDWFSKVTFVPFDINQSESFNGNIFDHFNRPDKLIHLSWEGLPNYNESFHLENNLLSNYYFLKKLIDTGLGDITVSGTCLEYGMQTGCLVETMKTDPQNPYAIAKDTLRRMMTALQAKKHFTFNWIRLFYIYGKGQSEKSLFTQLEKAIENKEKDFKMSKGEQVRDFLPVEDVADNIIKVSLSGNDSGIVNCCSGKPQTVKSFVENYFSSKNTDVKLILGFYPYPDYEPFSFWGDSNKLKSIVGNKS